jgi:hypothetical protein
MPDTGAPWNIPYVDPTDLVRDYPQASEDLAEAIADGLDAAGPAGIASNVVQAIQTDVFTTTSTSFLNVTGLQVTITPSSATSKILLLSLTNWSSGDGASRNCLVKIAGGNAGDFVGDASGTSERAAAMGGSRITTATGWSPTEHVFAVSLVYLDSPATASPVTYDVQVLSSGGTFHLNRSNADLDRTGRQASSLVAIEVAA